MQPTDSIGGDLPAENTPADSEIDSKVTAEQTPAVDEAESPSDEAVAEQGAAAAPTFTPEQAPVDFVVERPIFEPHAGVPPSLAECLPVYREAYKHVIESMNRNEVLIEKLNTAEERLIKGLIESGRELTDADGNLWLRTLMDAITTARLDSIGSKSASREGSAWRQVVDEAGVKMRMGKPVQGRPGQNASKEELVAYMARKTKTGAVYDVPCYHSGVWLRFKPCSLKALTAMQHELTQLRVSLGSDTKGMAFANTSQSLTAVAVDFALQYVIDANVSYRTPSDLKAKLLVTDIPAILLTMASAIYPEGYSYAAPCVADMQKCNHVVKEKLALDRILWTDINALNKAQRQHMATRFTSKYTDEQLAEYRRQHTHGGAHEVWFGDFGLRLTVPTIQMQEDAAAAWIDGIIEMTQGAFNEPAHGTNRNKYIERLGYSTTARQYAHFISAVLDRNDEGDVAEMTADVEVIAETLNEILSTDDYAEDFFQKVTDYIEDSLISMVALPSYNCPSCNTPTAEKFHERFEHLVPLDTLTTFFTLASRKLN